MKDCTSKTIYLGIDVHKKTYSVTAMCDGEVIKRDTMPAVPARLIAYCQKHFPQSKIVSGYEAGFSGFDLHRKLCAAGYDNKVIHPASIEIAARERVKNDKRDSHKISIQLAAGRLKSIHIPDEIRVYRRLVSRLRDSFVKHRRRVGSQVKAMLFLFGHIAHDDTLKVSAKWLREIANLNMDGHLKYCVWQLSNLWLHITEKIDELEKALELQAKLDSRIHEIYDSAPGLAMIGSRTLANELGDTLQFKSEKRLFSFAGLTPSEHSSGDRKHMGHITRQGSGHIRKVLVQAAWVAIADKEDNLGEIYQELKKNGLSSGKAIVGVARRLLGRIHSCLKKNELYKKRRPKVLT